MIMANLLLDRGHDVRILYYQKKSIKKHIKSISGIFYNNNDWLKEFRGNIKAFQSIDKCSFKKDEIIIGVGMDMSCLVAKLETVPNKKIQYIHGLTPWNVRIMEEALSSSIPKIAVSNIVKDEIINQRKLLMDTDEDNPEILDIIAKHWDD